MKKKILTWIVSVLFFIPCFMVLTACGGSEEKGFKILINNETFTADENNELVLEVGTEVSFSAVAILEDDSEKAIDTSLLTIVDEDDIIGTTPAEGTYEVTITYGNYPAIVVTIVIQNSGLAVPTATTASLTYTGAEQTLALTGFDATKMSITGNTGTNADDYTATVSLLDKVNTKWADGTTTDKTIAWTIAKAQAVAPTHTALSGTYDPAKTLADYTLDDNFVWVDNTQTPTVVSNTFEAKYNPDADNYLDAIVDITINIAKAQAVAPAHTALSGTYDPAKTLADYALNSGFAWTDSTIVPEVNTTVYTAVYNPDADNYLGANVNITLNIAKAQAVAPTHRVVTGTYDPAKTLADFDLEDGFVWASEALTVVPQVSTTTANAIYNPDADNYLDGTATINISISPLAIARPSLTEDMTYTYNGEEQEVSVEDFDDTKMSITGNKATDASNEITAVVTITDSNYVFEGGVATFNLVWAINPKTPVLTLNRSLEKEFDGLAINNPRYSVSEDVVVSYKFEGFDGENWQEIAREEISQVGLYRITIETEAVQNYAKATLTEEFAIYYDMAKLYVDTASEYSGYEYTGNAITPEVVVVIGQDDQDEPIMLPSSMYSVQYKNNINYLEDSLYEVIGDGVLCRGTQTGYFHIFPANMFSSIQVNDATLEINPEEEYPSSTVDLTEVPTSDMAVKLNIAQLYNNHGGEFSYIAYDNDQKPLVCETLIADNLEFSVPKETTNVTIIHYKDGSSYHVFWLGIYASSQENRDYNFEYFYAQNLDIDTTHKTILAVPGFDGDILDAIETAVAENPQYNLNGWLRDGNYTLSTVTQESDTIVFTFASEDKSDITVVYDIVTAPVTNYSYLSVYGSESYSFELDGYSNQIRIKVGSTGNIVAQLKTILGNTENYDVNETYANGYAVDVNSIALSNNIITITLTNADPNADDIVLSYEVIDETLVATTYIGHIENDAVFNEKGIEFDIYDQTITLKPGFSGDLASYITTNIQTFYLNSTWNHEQGTEIYPYTLLSASSEEGSKIRFTVEYQPDTKPALEYYFDFVVIDKTDGYCALESFTHTNMQGEQKVLNFDSNKYIEITETVSIADSFYLSFGDEGGITNWEVKKGEETVLNYTALKNMYGYDPYYVRLEGLTGTGVYTIIMYRGELTDTYTIEIKNYNDAPYFMFTYNEKDYVFSMDMSGNIQFVLNMETESPEYLYTYLGEIAEDATTMNIAVRSLVQTGYDQDKVLIGDFDNVTLKVLTDSEGRKYSLMYGEFDGMLMPIYFYHYEKEVVEGEDFTLKFANQDLIISKTPVKGEDEQYYCGDFMYIPADGESPEMLVGQITKSQLDYIDGDTTAEVSVSVAAFSDVIVINMNTYDFVMGCGNQSGTYSTPVTTEADATYLMFGISDMEQSYMKIVIVQIVDDIIEEPTE